MIFRITESNWKDFLVDFSVKSLGLVLLAGLVCLILKLDKENH